MPPLFQVPIHTSFKPGQLARPPLKTSDDHITFITEDAKKNLWIGTFSNGLTRYNLASKKITHFGNNADGSGNFKDNSGWSASASGDGLFWVSTQEANLYKVDLFANNLQRYNYEHGLFVNVIYEEPGIAYWYGTDNSVLVRKDIKTGALQRFISGNGVASNSINAIAGYKH